MLDLMKLKWREFLIFFSNKKHDHLSEKVLKPAKVHYLAFKDLGLVIALNEYVEIIKNNSCYIAAVVSVVVVVGLLCLVPPIAAYITTAGLTFSLLTMKINYFVEISDNLYN